MRWFRSSSVPWVSRIMYSPLTRDQLSSVIEGRSTADRVPVMIHLWVHPDTFGERESAVHDILGRYPMDAQLLQVEMPGVFYGTELAPDYRWLPWNDPGCNVSTAIDQQIALPDWCRLDEIVEHFPKAEYPVFFRNNAAPDGRYRLGHWWFTLFERHWSLRGMSNALMDYYTDPEPVHRLFRELTNFYKAIIVRAKLEGDVDGILISDDLGTQSATFFSLETFREFFKPYYAEIIETIHSLGMHAWLHACGCVEQFIPEFSEIGLDVLHPIQKHTMNEYNIVKEYGNKLCFWAGMDVQQVIPWGTPSEVRAEVRRLIDTYWKPGGHLIMTAGNGINGDCSLDSLEAFFDECMIYGRSKVL